jgi:hypothetical protein
MASSLIYQRYGRENESGAAPLPAMRVNKRPNEKGIQSVGDTALPMWEMRRDVYA